MVCDEDNRGLKQFERNKYFYGKLMTVRDFEAEQSYFNRKRYLLNRLISGVGIVCGLEVVELIEPETEGGNYKVKINPGVAIDCYGNEIVVGEEYAGKELEIEGKLNGDSNYLYIRYNKCETESVPVLSSASNCNEICCNNKVKEIFKLEIAHDAPEIKAMKDKIEELSKGTLNTQSYFREHFKGCQGCLDTDNLGVLLAIINEDLTIHEDTYKYRSLVYNNLLIYDILNSHISDRNVHAALNIDPQIYKFNLMFEYLRKRALKHTVIRFTDINTLHLNDEEIKEKLDSMIGYFEDVLTNEQNFKDIDIFIQKMKDFFENNKTIFQDLREGLKFSYKHVNDFDWSEKVLYEALNEDDAFIAQFKIANLLEELSFYFSLVETDKEREILNRYLRNRTLKQTTICFKKLAQNFNEFEEEDYVAGRDGSSQISQNFGRLISEDLNSYSVYKRIFNLFRSSLRGQLTDLSNLLLGIDARGAKGFESSVNGLISAIDYEYGDYQNNFKIVEALDELCSYVGLLDIKPL